MTDNEKILDEIRKQLKVGTMKNTSLWKVFGWTTKPQKDSKLAVLKSLRRICNFEKVITAKGSFTKINILEVYNELKEAEDHGLKGKESNYRGNYKDFGLTSLFSELMYMYVLDFERVEYNLLQNGISEYNSREKYRCTKAEFISKFTQREFPYKYNKLGYTYGMRAYRRLIADNNIIEGEGKFHGRISKVIMTDGKEFIDYEKYHEVIVEEETYGLYKQQRDKVFKKYFKSDKYPSIVDFYYLAPKKSISKLNNKITRAMRSVQKSGLLDHEDLDDNQTIVFCKYTMIPRSCTLIKNKTGENKDRINSLVDFLYCNFDTDKTDEIDNEDKLRSSERVIFKRYYDSVCNSSEDIAWGEKLKNLSRDKMMDNLSVIASEFKRIINDDEKGEREDGRK